MLKQWIVDVVRCINKRADAGWDANEMAWTNLRTTDQMKQWNQRINESVNQLINEFGNVIVQSGDEMFPWSPWRKFIILKTPICKCDIHASVRTQEKAGSTYFKIIFLWSKNVQHQEHSFHGGRVHSSICMVKAQKNDPWPIWGGMYYGSLHDYLQGCEIGFESWVM